MRISHRGHDVRVSQHYFIYLLNLHFYESSYSPTDREKLTDIMPFPLKDVDMKFCPNCGKKVEEDWKACPFCLSSFQTLSGLDTSSSAKPEPDKNTISGKETSTFKTGLMLCHRYEIKAEIGRGGMGEVYLAQDTTLNRTVAIKMLPRDLSLKQKSLEKFKQEAALTLDLTHPNIIRIYNFEENAGENFIIMEYIEGQTLEDLLEKKGRLSLEELIPIAEQIATGLDFAHSKKVLHPDIKPSNIMIDNAGHVKIADFGIARQLKDTITRITGKETTGTLLYMSPEQLMGEGIDHRSDIYSFAAVLYEALSGKPPFTQGHIPEQIRNARPADLKNTPVNANKAIQKGLKKSPSERFQTAGVMAKALIKKKGSDIEIIIQRIETPVALNEGKDYIENCEGLDLKMIWIKGGTFQMGSNGKADEKPPHDVTLDGFWMGETPVTQAQWKGVMGTWPSFFMGDHRPVENVSWNDAMDFCRKLKEKTGKEYTLPTEAQWEYSCRAGSRGMWCIGDDESQLKKYAWYYDNSGGFLWERRTHPVKQKKSNDFKLYDMHGNVWEWCLDEYESFFYSEPKAKKRNPLNEGCEEYHVFRGGSWNKNSMNCRSANRNASTSTIRDKEIGFRLSRSQ